MTVPRGNHRVLFVSHWDWVLWHFRLPVAEALRGKGYEVVMVCPEGPYVDGITASGFRHVEWRVVRESMRPARELVALLRLVAIYRRERPLVAHHFTVKPNLYGSVAATLARVPHVINTFSGLGSFLTTPTPRARFVLATWRRIATKRRWTIAQTEEDLERLVGHRLARRERATLVPGSGVDLEEFQPADRDPGMVVVAVTRLLYPKGVTEFVEAAKIVRKAEPHARFVLAGGRDAGSPEAVNQADLDRWRSDGAVELLGHVDDVAGLLRMASVAVLPTYYAEGVPRFLLEASASGVPIVTTPLPGCRAVVDHGVNGLIVPPRDSQALADAILYLLTHPDERRTMGARGRHVAVERYELSSAVLAYLSAYTGLGVDLGHASDRHGGQVPSKP